MRILLIEDNMGDRDLLLEAFRMTFPEDKIVTIEDGEKAIEALKKSHKEYELVILDLNLPKKDGLEILRSLRMEQNILSLPVVVLTTSRWQADHDASELLKADASFIKPALFTDYINLVKSIKGAAGKKISPPVKPSHPA